MTNHTEIIMCTYNGEHYIEKQLDSILYQSHRADVISIYDDNSQDKTFERLIAYEKKYKNIRLYQNMKRLGVNKNFEQGLRNTKADFIFLSDQDDIWHKDKIKAQLNIIQSAPINTPLLVHHDAKVINNSEKEILSSYKQFMGYDFKTMCVTKLLHQQGVMGHTIMLNKALLKHVLPFPYPLSYFDRWLALAAEIYGKRLYIDSPLVSYRTHGENLSNNKNLNQKSKQFFLRLKKHLLPNTCQRVELQSILHLLAKSKLSQENKEALLKGKSYLEKKLSFKELIQYLNEPYLKDFSSLQKLILLINYCFS